jgi:hypothetical protein
MECPECKKSISMFKMKKELVCPNCGTLLRCENFLKMMVIGLTVIAIVTFILDLFPSTLFTSAVYYAVLCLAVIYYISNTINYTVVRKSKDRTDEK